MERMPDWDDKTSTFVQAGGSADAGRRDRAYLIVLAGNNVGEMYKVQDNLVIGRGQESDVRIIDEGISRRHARFNASDEHCFVEDLGSTNGTFLNGERVARHVLKDGDKIQVGSTTILKFTYHDDLDENFQRQMYESALRDGLTKIFNKKYFLDRLESEFSFAIRHGSALSLVMFDIDHFKKVNDTYGHLAGDNVLVNLARAMNDRIRSEDVFARYGGEEFAIICRGTGQGAAQALGERVRRSTADQVFTFNTETIPVTVSVGVASMPDSEIKDPVAFVSAADEALYQAKRAGRNRVVVRQSKT